MLHYLFTAHFTDDTSIQQTQEDVSAVSPTGSAFTDVKLALDSGKQLASFTLVEQVEGEEREPNSYTVDLLTGQFIINTAPVWLIPEGLEQDPTEFRVIYWRQHSHDINVMTGQEVAHTIRFVLGWQCTVNEKNYQQTITLD